MVMGSAFNAWLARLNSLSVWFYICIGTAFAKLLLVSKNEIVVMPHDAASYVARSVHGIADIGLMHVGYPFWLSLSKITGMPQRISIELLYLLSCFYLVNVIRKRTSIYFSTLLFILLAFAPFTYFLFDQALSDGFYICLVMFATGLSIQLLAVECHDKKDIYWKSIGLGCFLGMMLLTRAEDQIVIFWLVALAVLCLLASSDRLSEITRVRSLRKPLSILVIAGVVSWLIVSLFSSVFYVRNSVYARTITLLPGHYQLLKNMASIDTGVPQVRYIPVSRASRELAYRVSPTLSGLQDIIENPDNVLNVASRRSGLPDGEIGAGWIWWVFIGALLEKYPNIKPVDMNKVFHQINVELEKAFDDGVLNKRFIVNPLVGGNLPQLMSDLPSAVVSVVNKHFDSYRYINDQDNDPVNFNLACNRRAALIGNAPKLSLYGWAFADSPDTEIESIAIVDSVGNAGHVTYVPRDDVERGFEKVRSWKPVVFGFHAEIEASWADGVSLVYSLSDGSEVASASFEKGGVVEVGPSDGATVILQGLDEVVRSVAGREGSKHRLQNNVLKFMSSDTIKILAAISLIMLLACLILVAYRRQILNYREILFVEVFLLLVISARVLFYSIIESAAWDVEIRYLAATQVLIYIFLSIALYFSYAVFRNAAGKGAKN